MVFYRKYRPQKIADLDSTAVRELLSSVFAKRLDSIPHAFLFTGPKGLGKTSAARIVAKTVNCEHKNQESGIHSAGSGQVKNQGDKKLKETHDSSFIIHDSKSMEPCNVCESCLSITNGTNLDVLEIDAASNRGIDEIRDLKEKIRLAPVSSLKKIYIIDEVHMLTTEAFNALLKTLEEPPSHALFVLCTTEPHKILSTIISRCFHIHFSLATAEEIVHSFKRIVAGEKLQIDDEVLYAVAKMADGGFRDGAKVLEELVLISRGQKITKALFDQSYKTANVYLHVADFLGALGDKDAKSALKVTNVLVSQGIDMRYFISQVLTDLHTKLLKKMGVEKTSEGEFPLNLRFDINEIKELVTLLGKTYQEVKYAVLPQLPLELAVIEWTTLKLEIGSERLDNQLSNIKLQNPASTIEHLPSNGITVSHLRKQVGEMQKNQALYGSPKQSLADAKSTVQTVTIDLMKVPADGQVTKEWQDALWKSIISEMKNYNHTVAGVLRSCGIKSYSKEEIIIEAAYKFHKERLDDLKTREELGKICKMLTGNTVKIGVELRNG